MINEENLIKDINNYYPALQESFEGVSKKFIETINYYILHSKLNIKTTNTIFLKGISIITNIFKLILYYTKNLELTVSTCNRGIFYYIEYINQINEKDNEYVFVNLNLKDAITYVYRKTIFLIDDSYKKSYVLEESEKLLFNTFNTFTNFYIKIMHSVFNSINLKLIDQNELDSNLLNLYNCINNIQKYTILQKKLTIQNKEGSLKQQYLEKNLKIFDLLVDSNYSLDNNNIINPEEKNNKLIFNNICLMIEDKIKELT